MERPWMLSNTLAFSFATQAITLLRLESFVAGSALLGGLFLYDVFWVFGTPVVSDFDAMSIDPGHPQRDHFLRSDCSGQDRPG